MGVVAVRALQTRINAVRRALRCTKKHIAKMKAEGILKRIGPDKGGHWQVVENL